MTCVLSQLICMFRSNNQVHNLRIKTENEVVINLYKIDNNRKLSFNSFITNVPNRK